MQSQSDNLSFEPDLVDQPDGKPTRKVTGGAVVGGATGAATTVLIMLWDLLGGSEPLSVETAAAVVTVVTVLGNFIGGYMTRERGA